MNTFAEKVIRFNRELDYAGDLPDGIRIMNPFKENREIESISRAFYEKFYNDQSQRRIILGINPGRLGAGTTGIPFTDTKRLSDACGIPVTTAKTHEPSSVFIYQMIRSYGGVNRFYSDFFIHSVCPLGFIRKNQHGNWTNYNYYDDDNLFLAVKPYIVESLRRLIGFGIDTDTCFVLGKKNAQFLKVINEEVSLFTTFQVLDHPRYIVQYKSNQKERYIHEYVRILK